MKLTPKQQREYEQNQKAMREAAQQLRMEQGSLKSPSMVTSVDGLGTDYSARPAKRPGNLAKGQSK